MSLLAPWFLLLGTAALVPLLLHLLRRRIGQRVDFPAARYLARAEREHSRTLRLRNLLLMLLRVVAVVLLAVAAARPMARLIGTGHGPTALAVVLDNSLSTSVVEGGRPLSGRLAAMAHDALARGSPTDRLWLVTADGEIRGGSAADLAEGAQHVKALGGAGDPALALARAAAAVTGSGLPARQVVLLTDGQKSSWRAPPRTGNVDVLAWIPVSIAPPNRAVVSAEAQPARWTPRGSVEARVMAADSTTYRIALGGRTLARGTIAPGEEVLVRAAPAERGWMDGTVELDPDELPADNVRHFAAWIGPAPRVGTSPSAGPFVQSALDVLKSDGRVVDGGDVAITSADELTRLPALIVAPSLPVRVGAANRALERAGVPWRLGAERHGSETIRGTGVARAEVVMRYVLQPVGSSVSDTLATVGAEPWVVAGPQYVLVASPLSPEATSFPVSASFVPWIADQIASRLAGDAGRVLATAPGQHVSWPTWADVIEGSSDRHAAGSDFITPRDAGTWFFIRNGRRVGALTVNPEPEESVLDRWAPAEFAKLLGSHARVAGDPQAWLGAVFDASSRRSVVVPLLIALLVVLAAETLLAGRDGAGEG